MMAIAQKSWRCSIVVMRAAAEADGHSYGRTRFFLESTFTDQNNPKRQMADPLWGSPKVAYGRTRCSSQ
jgi:hypothetical protein